MRLGIISVLVGILIFHSLPEWPGLGWSVGLTGLLLILIMIPRLRLLGWGVGGFLWALFWTDPGQQLPAHWES